MQRSEIDHGENTPFQLLMENIRYRNMRCLMKAFLKANAPNSSGRNHPWDELQPATRIFSMS